MKKKTTIILLALLVLAVLARFAQVTFGSMGEGNGVESPDKRFLAHAQSFYTTKFWGGKRNYYEFTIKSAAGRRIHHLVMDEPPQGMISVRQDDWIKWAADSSSVTYTFKGTQLTLSINP
jgi:hypothetical protein